MGWAMELAKMESDLQAIEADASLCDELCLGARTEALDHIAFMEEVARLRGSSEVLAALEQRTQPLRLRLERANGRLYGRIRDRIVSGEYTPAQLRAEFDQFTAYSACDESPVHVGYDALDVLVDGVLRLDQAPEAVAEREPGMVHLEPTPARAILELIDRVPLGGGDVFCDLGSGLGQVVILVNLLTGVKARGVEVEPAYCEAAQICADGLGLANVAFLNVDAREADLSDGTVFFMFTPFTGRMLEQVLAKLRDEATGRALRICTYGPCTTHVAQRPWLRNVDGNAGHEFKLAVFQSIQ